MKRNHLILIGIFLFIVVAKIYVLTREDYYFGIPQELQILNIIGIILLFISLILINLKQKKSKLFIILAIISAYTESIWKYSLNDMSILYLGYILIGYSVLGIFLWSFATTQVEIAEDIKKQNQQLKTKK